MLPTIIAFALVLLNILIFIFGGIGYSYYQYGGNSNIFDLDEGSSIILLFSTLILIILSVIIAILIIGKKVEENKKNYVRVLVIELVFSLLVAIIYLVLSNISTGYWAGVFALIVLTLTGILLIRSKNIPTTAKVNEPKKDETPSNNADKKISDLEEKIVKLEEMKNKGLINEEEFNRIKSRYLDEYCK